MKYLQKELGMRVYILSGDAMSTVKTVGEYLGIPLCNLLGETDAESKRKLLRNLRKEEEEAMMIGDGLNDVLSLKEAGVGVSINAKSELNLMAADVIVMNENLWKIVCLFNLMRTANNVVYINLLWAFAYNIFIARIL